LGKNLPLLLSVGIESLISRRMSPHHPEEEDRAEPVALPPLPLHPDVVRWLAARAGGDDAKAAQIVASILREIQVDDDAMHRTLN
jgi:hypothetical protein